MKSKLTEAVEFGEWVYAAGTDVRIVQFRGEDICVQLPDGNLLWVTHDEVEAP